MLVEKVKLLQPFEAYAHIQWPNFRGQVICKWPITENDLVGLVFAQSRQSLLKDKSLTRHIGAPHVFKLNPFKSN